MSLKRPRKSSHKTCYCCGNNSSSCAYFKFPSKSVTQDNRRNAWIRVLGISEPVGNNICICNNHFEDKYFKSETKDRRLLTNDAVPSIGIQIPAIGEIKKQRIAQNKSRIPLPDPVSAEIDKSGEISELPIERSTPVLPLSDPVGAEIDKSAEISELQIASSHHGLSTPTSPDFRVPKYLNQIKSPHLATPRCAKACFDVARQAVFKKAKIIKGLHQELRRARKKITDLTDLLDNTQRRIYDLRADSRRTCESCRDCNRTITQSQC